MIKISKEKYRAAIIGVGRIGMKLELDKKRIKPATHFGMWDYNSDVDLVAVCDTSDENLKMSKKLNPNINIYKNAQDLLEKEKPDIVSIATWKDTHYDMMKLCIKYNIPAIVCEKPIAEKIEHAHEIVQETKENGIHLFINHRRRFDPLLYPFKNDLNNGIIDSKFIVPWENFKNTLLVTNSEGLNRISTRIFKILKINEEKA